MRFKASPLEIALGKASDASSAAWCRARSFASAGVSWGSNHVLAFTGFGAGAEENLSPLLPFWVHRRTDFRTAERRWPGGHCWRELESKFLFERSEHDCQAVAVRCFVRVKSSVSPTVNGGRQKFSYCEAIARH